VDVVAHARTHFRLLGGNRDYFEVEVEVEVEVEGFSAQCL
jgi:hypothetical protein